jgi:uncharacterized protein with PIN domain
MSDSPLEKPPVHEGTVLPPGEDDAERLRAEIERTREHLGATVEQLAAKLDVKQRAREKATELTGQLTGRAKNVTAQARKQAAQLRKQGAAPEHRAELSTAGACLLAAVVLFILWRRSRR